jgi:PAS domain S-box-containing protein
VLLLKSNSLELVDFNTTAYQTLGFTSKEFRKVNLRDLLIVQPPDTVAEMERRIVQSVREPVESMLSTKSGHVRHFRIQQQTIKLSGVQYLLGIWLDITEQRRLEEYLMQSQKMETIGTLAGGVAHDFNNILSIIIGNTELALQDGAGNSSLEKRLGEIQTACRRARDVVVQLLSISRQNETSCTPILLAPVIDESMRLLRVSIPATIEIRQNICSRPLCVLSDGTQIQQVLINLCTNAVHAMEPDGGLLKVSLASASLNRTRAGRLGLDAGEYACINVEDTGTGIEPAHMERIFEPCFSTKPAHRGTGMGLAMVHSIVTKYGGAITVESQTDRGTRFDLFLPLSDFSEAMSAPGPVASLTGCGRVK